MGNEGSVAREPGAGGSDTPQPTELDLSGQQLATLPAALQSAAGTLRRLSLENNALGGCREWDALGALTGLETLGLAHNALAAVPDAVAALTALTQLGLAHNNLRELPAALAHLARLRALDAGYNALRAVPPALAQCTALTSLDVSHNLFEALPAPVCALPRLARLIADNNAIRAVPPAIGALTALTHLSLSENYIAALPDALGTLPALAKLYLDNNELAAVPPAIGGLTALRELSLSANRLVALPPAFARLSALRLAYLDDNPWHAPEYLSDDVEAVKRFVATETEVSPLEDDYDGNSGCAATGGGTGTVGGSEASGTRPSSLSSSSSPVPSPSPSPGLSSSQSPSPAVPHRLSKKERRERDSKEVTLRRKHLRESENVRLRTGSTSLALAAYARAVAKDMPAGTSSNTVSTRAPLSRTASVPGIGSNSDGNNSPSGDDEYSNETQENLTSSEGSSETTLFTLRRICGTGRDLVSLRVERRAEALREEDGAFVLDSRRHVFAWVGAQCEPVRRGKALALARQLAESTFMRADALVVLDYTARSGSPGRPTAETEELFWRELDGSTRTAHRARRRNTPEEDAVVARNRALDRDMLFKLFSVQELRDQRVHVACRAEMPLLRSALQSAMSFVLDDGVDVWVWAGRYSQANERNWAHRKALEILRHSARSDDAVVNWALDGMEPVLFAEHFADWLDASWAYTDQENRERLAQQQRQRDLIDQANREDSAILSLYSKPAASAASEILTSATTAVTDSTQKQPERQASLLDKPPARAAPLATVSDVESEGEIEEEGSITSEEEGEIDNDEGAISDSEVEAEKMVAPIAITIQPPQEEEKKVEEKVKIEEKVEKKVEEPKKETKEKEKVETTTTTTTKTETIPKTDDGLTQEEIDKVTRQVEAEMRAEGRRRGGQGTDARKGRSVVLGSRKRRAPTRNPVRERMEKEARQELTSTTAAIDAARAKEASAAAGVLGGYGLLYSVKADEYLFAQRRGRNTERELLEAANRRDGDGDAADIVPRPVVVPKDLPRLIHVKGRRRPFCRQVERTWQSLNSGDCFVLDEGKFGRAVYQWNGRGANRIEKGKAMDIAKNIRDKERFNSRVVLVDEGREPPEFWAALGGAPPGGQHIASAAAGGDDEEAERAYPKFVTLYRVVPVNSSGSAGASSSASTANGSISKSVPASKTAPSNIGIRGSGNKTMEVTLESVCMGKALVRAMLVPGNCYIMDCVSEVYAWTDTQASGPHRRATVARAAALADEHAAQCWVAPVYHEWAGSEQVMFRERFYGWNAPPISVSQPAAAAAAQRPRHGGITSSAAGAEAHVNIAAMYGGHPRRSEDVMVDDGTGRTTVYLVEEFRRVRLEDSAVGEFYSGDSYVVLYRYVWKNKDCYLIYFWQGRAATVLNKGSSAALTMELDDRLKSTIEAALSKEVRVVQGKEPRHFLTVFAGRFIVHDGRDPRSSVQQQQQGQQAKRTHLYQISGNDEIDTHAVETSTATASALSSSGVFLVADGAHGQGFVWEGRFANAAEKHCASTVAPHLAERLGVAFAPVREGAEPAAFWTALGCAGGRDAAHYPEQGATARAACRLFVCSVASGAFGVEELGPFSQDDLDPDDAVILDARDTVFVWIGARSHPAEQRLAMETAVAYGRYAAQHDAARPRHAPCLRVVQGAEPLVFTARFHGWQDKPAGTALSKSKGAAAASAAAKSKAPPPVRSYDGDTVDVEAILKELSRKYSYEDLLAKKFPKGLDESALETYLEDDEFEKLFGMTRAAFAKLPMWQRINIKRRLHLW